MSAKDVQTRACGALHPDGVVCTRGIWYEKGCCTDVIYRHKGPHEAVDKEGGITHRWREVTDVEDLPFNGYHSVNWDEEEGEEDGEGTE